MEPNPPDFVVAYNQRRLMNKKRKRNGRKPKSRRGDSPPSKKLKLGKKTKGTAKSIEQLDNDENAVVSILATYYNPYKMDIGYPHVLHLHELYFFVIPEMESIIFVVCGTGTFRGV